MKQAFAGSERTFQKEPRFGSLRIWVTDLKNPDSLLTKVFKSRVKKTKQKTWVWRRFFNFRLYSTPNEGEVSEISCFHYHKIVPSDNDWDCNSSWNDIIINLGSYFLFLAGWGWRPDCHKKWMSCLTFYLALRVHLCNKILPPQVILT